MAGGCSKGTFVGEHLVPSGLVPHDYELRRIDNQQILTLEGAPDEAVRDILMRLEGLEIAGFQLRGVHYGLSDGTPWSSAAYALFATPSEHGILLAFPTSLRDGEPNGHARLYASITVHDREVSRVIEAVAAAIDFAKQGSK